LQREHAETVRKKLKPAANKGVKAPVTDQSNARKLVEGGLQSWQSVGTSADKTTEFSVGFTFMQPSVPHFPVAKPSVPHFPVATCWKAFNYRYILLAISS
jgi:hypothetical protein